MDLAALHDAQREVSSADFPTGLTESVRPTDEDENNKPRGPTGCQGAPCLAVFARRGTLSPIPTPTMQPCRKKPILKKPTPRNLLSKNKEQRTRVSCSQARTLPRVLRQNQACKLLKRRKRLAGRLCGDGRTCGLYANHSIFKRAEAADTSLVQGDWNARREVD